jgi:hypothetical protein
VFRPSASDIRRREYVGQLNGPCIWADTRLPQEEIVWILDAADKLEGFRDDSAHTPLRYLFRGVVPDMKSAATFPETTFQNPRAIRLEKKGRDMVTEYRYARERIIVLRDYIIAIDAAWSNTRLPWPDRPDLPERKPRKARQNPGTHKSK